MRFLVRQGERERESERERERAKEIKETTKAFQLVQNIDSGFEIRPNFPFGLF